MMTDRINDNVVETAITALRSFAMSIAFRWLRVSDAVDKQEAVVLSGLVPAGAPIE
jgi:hypothetical protein